MAGCGSGASTVRIPSLERLERIVSGSGISVKKS
jgi:hypothetical protein